MHFVTFCCFLVTSCKGLNEMLRFDVDALQMWLEFASGTLKLNIKGCSAKIS